MARNAGRRGVDGSFGRSAGAAAGRGALLLLIAVVLGVILLQTADDGDPTGVVVADDRPARTTTTEALPQETTLPTVPLKPPPEVRVRIANGTQTRGLGKRYTDVITPAGYNALTAVDTSRKPIEGSAVYFKPGFDREARVIAELLGIAATAVQPMPDPAPVTEDPGDVLVVLGTDAASGPPGPAASTTAPPAATTVP